MPAVSPVTVNVSLEPADFGEGSPDALVAVIQSDVVDSDVE